MKKTIFIVGTGPLYGRIVGGSCCGSRWHQHESERGHGSNAVCEFIRGWDDCF